ncbi:uncharacterized protein LOC121995048 [Zingiber officinale]|uniref:uncharacterized protein LOC121995048 n=1 Tax=Zingiber officinale TaxID=94328 RepID=UPI001C4A916E|nr:uncharacterized protein LOC121995048 [Zingiber officinale]
MSLTKDPSLELGSQAWLMLEDGESSDSLGSYSSSLLPFFSNHICPGENREALSVVKYGAVCVPSASVLSFEQEDRDWMDAIDQSCKLDTNSRIVHEQDSFGLTYPSAPEKRQCKVINQSIVEFMIFALGRALLTGVRCGYRVAGFVRDAESEEAVQQKDEREVDQSVQGFTERSSEDLILLQNRRERISERLKILQELVPNGTKVDMVTMLEKAISYVKFLQLQVKVLATDEFWPAQGGRAPDIGQVKEAIDAILCSQRDRNSSSKL